MTSARPAAAELEALLAHDAFVRGLARQLVRDVHVAEDAAQDAWLAALRAQVSGPIGSPRGFFATVLERLVGRHLRTQRREAARRALVAMPSAAPSTDEILEREALRADLVQRVLALDPPQRDVVVLRFFEQLPPRRIAQRLQLPVETVRTRIKRAMARLRAQLEQRHGGSAALVPLLEPLAAAPLGSAWLGSLARRLASGASCMSMKKVVAAAAAFLALALGWWAFGPALAAVAPSLGSVVVVPAEMALPGGGEHTVVQRAPSPTAVASRSEVPAVDAGSGTGELVVRVRFADNLPAADCWVELRRGNVDRMFDVPRRRTDANGQVRFIGVAPGRVWPEVLRGGNDSRSEVDICAGATAEVDFQIAAGMDVEGVVVDASGQPIADAEVLVADWGAQDALPMATTRVNGTFALRSLAVACYVGARATGLAASRLQQVTAGRRAPGRVRIVLDTAAVALRGQVLDAAGRPVAGAAVQAGDSVCDSDEFADGSVGIGRRPERAATDRQGCFALLHLPPGSHRLAVRARGLAPATQWITLVAGEAPQLTVTLVDGVTLVGRVVDAAAQPVRAVVAVGDHGDFGYRAVKAAPDGSFRLEGLAPGTLSASVVDEYAGRSQASLSAVPGQTLAWNPVLDSWAVLRGRVVDEAGAGVADADVVVQSAAGLQLGDGRPAISDADGRFEIAGWPPAQALRLLACRKDSFATATIERVVPAEGDVVVLLPTGSVRIRGRISDPEGRVVDAAQVCVSRSGANVSRSAEVDPVTGVFDLGPFAAGDYSLCATAPGFPAIELPRRRLASGETWDLGEVRLVRGGEVEICVVAPAAPLVPVAAIVRDSGGRRVDSVPLRDGRGRFGPLPPGEYWLHAGGETAAMVAVPFWIEPAVTTPVRVEVAAGTRVDVAAAVPATLEAHTCVAFTVFAAGSMALAELAAHPVAGRAQVRLALAPGSYRIEAAAAGLRTQSVACVVSADGAPVPVVFAMMPP